MKKINIKLVLLIVVLCSSLNSCQKYIEIDPPVTSTNFLNVFQKENTAISAVNGLYVKLINLVGTASMPPSIYMGLSADELRLHSEGSTDVRLLFYKNSLVSNAAFPNSTIWNNLYSINYENNLAIQGLISNSQNLSASSRQQLLGETKFLRAFVYFYLVNLFGDVPLIITTDPEINRQLSRTPKAEIYRQIITDLKEAQVLLNLKFLDGALNPYASNVVAERVRPTYAAASALLARIYLYNGEFALAEEEASKVISDVNQFSLLPLNSVFLKNSKEAIWQLQPIQTGVNTFDGTSFILSSTGPNETTQSYSLSQSLLSAFESGDQRAVNGNWINQVTTNTGITYRFPFKYKAGSGVVTEYYMILRLAEQYLIRAEARAQQGKLTGSASAADDLNVIRIRAGLLPINPIAANKETILDAILKERRVELFTELGHRWLDIKRVNKVDEIMNNAAIEKQTIWQSYQQLYPIPFVDINRASQLNQNPGYN